MFQLTPARSHLYDVWLDEALKDDTVWPYLTDTKVSYYTLDFSNDWTYVCFMDDNKLGFAKLVIHRDTGISCTLDLHVLGTQGEKSRIKAATEIIRSLFGGLIKKKYGLKYLDLVVHETNKTAMKFLMKRFKECVWGIKPEGIWDSKIGKFVNAHHFRIKAEDHPLGKYNK